MNSDHLIHHKFHNGRLRSLTGFFLSFMVVTVCAQNRLPPCVGKSISSWTGCTGQINSGTTNLYTGEFMNGKKHGRGEATISKNTGDDRYVGQFREGRMHGRGTYYFSNGGKYEGGWMAGKKEGTGVETWGKVTKMVRSGREAGRLARGKAQVFTRWQMVTGTRVIFRPPSSPHGKLG